VKQRLPLRAVLFVVLVPLAIVRFT